MTALVCKHCGCAGSDLDPQCQSCGGSLPEGSNNATLRSAHEDAAGSDRASRIELQAAQRYTRLREVARGGSGRIVAARDVVFERWVAIKEPLEPGRGGARLRAEAEILACLQHPPIVPVYRLLAERALKLQSRRAPGRARSQFILARVLWNTPADRPRARELALAARATYAQLEAQRSRVAVDLADWMKAHDVR